MPAVGDELRPLYEAAVNAASRYPMDDIVLRRQRDHLDGVRDAGDSGDQVPPPGSPG